MTVDTSIAGLVAAELFERRKPAKIIYDEQIEQSVIVKIDPGRTDGPLTGFDLRLGRDIFECAIAAIPVQRTTADTCHKQIHMAIVIEISGGGAHRIPCSLNMGRRCHV